MDSVENLQREFRRADGSTISRDATTDWKSCFREIPMMYYVANPIKIGGPGTIVEVDETFVSHAKYNRGRDPGAKKSTTKIFGGVERGTKKCFMVEVPDTKKETLWPHILNSILPGTTIMSDGLRVTMIHKLVCNYSLLHKRTCKRTYLTDDLGDHTQSIESNWNKFKQDRIKSKYGAAESLFTSYINEYIWKKEFNDNRMFELWKLIGQLFPCT